MSNKNKKIVLDSAINGVPRADNFRAVETDILEPGDGEILVRHIQ